MNFPQFVFVLLTGGELMRRLAFLMMCPLHRKEERFAELVWAALIFIVFHGLLFWGGWYSH